MSTRIVTLFGEEIVPEPQKPAGKGRAKKSERNAPAEAETPANEETPESQPAAEVVAADAQEANIPADVIAGPQEDAQVLPSPAPVRADQTIAPAEDDSAAPAQPQTTKKSRKRTGEDGMLAKPDADIIPEDWAGDKKYYTIGEVAGFFKVNTSHIRFWTNEFKLKVRTTRKGDRLYTPDQVRELRAIYHLVKERGFTLSGARTKLKEQNKRDVTTVDLKTSLTELRGRLVKLRDQLT